MDRLEHKLLKKVAKASEQHGLLAEGDRVMVAMSGGKDSFVMFHLLREVQRRVPFRFELLAVHLDQHQPGFRTELLTDWLAQQDVPWEVVSVDTYSIVKEKTPEGQPYCAMCSRLRRGILYSTAVERGCTKIALGHHRDDSLETLLLNLFYGGRMQAMPAKLTSDDGRNTVIRPLIACAEKDIATVARTLGFPTQPCTVCSGQPDLQRARVKALLDQLEGEMPMVRASMFAALSNVRPSHLLDPTVRRDAPLGGDAVEEALAAVERGGEAHGCGIA